MLRHRTVSHIIIQVVLLVLSSSPLIAASFTAYGLETFQRESGAPVTVTKSFAVINPNTIYSLKIYNGGLEDADFEKVSSSVINLNGLQIIGPDQFNQNVQSLEKSVTLSFDNILSVQVRGKPGGAIVIAIIGEDDDPPTISAAADPAPNAAGWNQTDVTVTFTCSDETSGISTCPEPVTVSMDGINQSISGTAIDNAGNTTTASVALNIDKTPPTIDVTSPAAGSTLNTSNPDISVQFSEGVSGIDPASVRFSLDGNDATSDASITASGLTYTPSTALQDGPHSILVAASDNAGNTSNAMATFTTKTKIRPFIFPEPGFDSGSYQGETNIFNGPMKVDDINRDGIPDVVVLNHIAGVSVSKISLILGKGNGSFQKAVIVGEINNGYYDDIAVEDINGDGSPDMAVTVFLPNQQYGLVLLIGNGDATFTTGSNHSIVAPGKILTGNFNSDPYKDIAIAGQNGSVILYQGNGDGSISVPMTVWTGTPGTRATDAVAADFNHDGLADIGVIQGYSSGGHELLVLLNNGNGEFQPAVVIPWDISFYFSNLTFGDLNGDGFDDIVLLRDGQYYLRPDVMILMNDGSGNFPVGRIYSPGLVIPTNNFSIFGGRMARLFDVTGDQRFDLLISYFGTVYTFTGNGDGTFQPPSEWSVSGGSLNIGDFDRDGTVDLVTVGLNHIFTLFGRANGGFIERVEIPTNRNVNGLTSADIDGDRAIDLVLPGNDFSTLFSTILNRGNTWVENNESPPFQGDRTYRAGTGPVFVKMGDLDKNGHPDLVTANELSNNVSVFLNKGASDLNPAVSYPVGSAPVFIALEDLNGDGNLDIITANSGSNDISILIGTPDGGFLAQRTYSTGPNPKSLAVADINGDNRPDILVADYNTSVNYVSILLGNGDGTFQPHTKWTTSGWSQISIQPGDFNRDGLADFIVLNYTLFNWGGIHQSQVTLLLGKGDGTFDERIVYQPGDAFYITDILSDDLNRDGKPDLIAIDDHAYSAYIFLNDGYGQFSQTQTLDGLEGSSISLGEINQDGDIDIVAGGGTALHTWLGQGDGTFLSGRSIGGIEAETSVAIGDMDGDGVSDVVFVDGHNLAIIPGTGDGIFPGESPIPEEMFSDQIYAQVDSIASADFNDDNNIDIVFVENPYDSNSGTSGGYYPKAVIYWGRGDSTFNRGPTFQTNTLFNRGVLAADLNDDGLVDIALSNDREILIGINNGNDTFKPLAAFPSENTVAGKLIAADLNHDNHLDLIRFEGSPINNLAGTFSHRISIYTGHGDGEFQLNGTVLLDPVEPADLVVQDFNGDGTPDLAVSMVMGNTLQIFLNNGNGTFSNPITSEVGIYQGSLTAEDYNNDGFMDLIIRDIETINLLPGNGDGTFQPATAYGLGEIASGKSAGMVSKDFSLDGRMDFATTTGISHLNLLLNQMSPLYSPPSPPKYLTGSAGDGRVSLTWTASPEDEIVAYNLYRSLSSGGGYEKINPSFIASISYTDTSVVNGQIYYYAVTAINTQGDESSLSKKVKLTPRPGDTIPPLVKITNPVNGGIVVSPLMFVSGTLDDSSAVVTVNGLSAAVQKQSGTFTAYNIPLNAGLNSVTVEAIDPAGNRSSDTVTVTYTLPARMNGMIQAASTGYPIQGAIVSILDADGPQTMTTGPDGLYSFIRLVPGEVTLTVTPSVNIYQSVTLVKTILPGQIMTLNIPLDLMPAILTGTVYDSFPLIDNPKPWLRVYNPIDGATVVVTDGDKSQTVVTDANGLFQAENIKPYEITVSISRTGYEPLIQDQYISPGQTDGIDYYLDKLPPAAPTGLVATPVTRGVELKWNANSETDLLGYNVFRATTTGGDYTLINPTPIPSPSFKDSGLPGGTTYYYVVTAINTSYRESDFSTQAAATTPLPTLPISIAYPVNGAFIDGSSVVVTGTIDATLTEVGVVIELNGPNGVESVPASVNRNAFAALVPLQDGANTITAVARNPSGDYGEASVTVDVSVSQEDVMLTANPSSGVPDVTTGTLSVKLQIETTLTNPVTEYQWDLNGNGIIDRVGETLSEVSTQYDAVGIYYPTVTVIDTMGKTYTATTVVNVLSRGELDAVLKTKWTGMRDALRQGNIDQAVSFFTFGSQEKYRQIFEAISDQLADEAANLPDVVLVTFYGTTGKYRIQRDMDINGQVQTLTYWVYFIQDTDGIWRIKQF